jgi:hypothetical protein
MAIEKVVKPYEFLARWRDGVLTGAHVQFISTIVEDGVVMPGSERLSDAMPVDVGGLKGFPLADILQQLHTDALAAVDAANKAKDAAMATRVDALNQLAKIGTELEQEKAANSVKSIALAQAMAQINALKSAQ